MKMLLWGKGDLKLCLQLAQHIRNGKKKPSFVVSLQDSMQIGIAKLGFTRV